MSELKTIIDANIKENGNQEITGKTLNYVLNKIAEGTEKDWNESDATKGGYIKGRTHGVTYELVSVEGTLKELGYVPGEYVSVLHYARVNGVLEGKGLYLGGLLYNPIVGEEYEVKYAGPSVYAKVVEVEDGYDVQIKGASDTGNILKVAIVGYKTIDDAYISTDIARKSQVDALEQKLNNLPQGEEFDKQGNYPLLHVGTADDLAGRGESVPAEFTFRASGGKSIKDGRAYIKRIKGNSVVWNQLIQGSFIGVDADVSEDSKVYNVTPTGTFPGIKKSGLTPIIGHKYIVVCFKSGGAVPLSINWGGLDVIMTNPIINPTDASKGLMSLYAYKETEFFTLTKPIIIDLTKMFQEGNEPTTIEEFYARIPMRVDLNAYNEGEVIHMNTESIKSVGDNAFDNSRNSFKEYNLTTDGDFSLMNTQDLYVGVTKNGYSDKYAITQYAKTDNGYSFVNTRGGYGIGAMVKALPNEDYHIERTSEKGGIGIGFYDSDKHMISFIYNLDGPTFTTPNNCAYILLILTAQDAYIGQEITISNIMLTLVHSGWKQDTDAGYQPYWQDILPLPIIRKYFPQGMKSAGSAHDEIRYNKNTNKWEKITRIGSVDLGDYDWVIREYNGLSCFSARKISIGATWDGETHNFICAKYSCVGGAEIYAGNDKSLSLNNGYFGNQDYKDHIVILDTDYTDVASFKAAMAGVILYYELAEPIVTELDAEDQNFRDYYNVADFGTEMSQSEVPSANFSADIIYQFNAVDMIREHELEITELQSIIATMQAQLASLASMANL